MNKNLMKHVCARPLIYNINTRSVCYRHDYKQTDPVLMIMITHTNAQYSYGRIGVTTISTNLKSLCFLNGSAQAIDRRIADFVLMKLLCPLLLYMCITTRQ